MCIRDSASAADTDRAACAIECIHTYSLVHDDLPAMDDDDPVSYTHLTLPTSDLV